MQVARPEEGLRVVGHDVGPVGRGVRLVGGCWPAQTRMATSLRVA